MNKILPFLLLALFILSCTENDPIAVNQFSLPVPSGTPTIDKSLLLSGTSFAVGYANGNIRSDRVKLTWQQSGDADFLAYKVYRNNTLLRTVTDVHAVSVIDSNLVQNRYYSYTLAVLNQRGVSRLDSVTIKTPRFQPPVITFQVLTDTTLELLWGHTAESATSYTLQKSLDGTTFQFLAAPPDTSYNDRTVTNLTRYYYRITAISPYESTAVSPVFQYQVLYQMAAPSGLSLQQLLPARQVRLTWFDNSSAEGGFRVYRRRGPGGTYSQVGAVGTNVTTYIDADTASLTADSTYSYRVQAFNQRDTSGRSNEVSITIFQPAPRPTWVVRPPSTMGAFADYPASWHVARRTNNTHLIWFGAASGASPSQSGPADTTYPATLNFSVPGFYNIYATYVDSLFNSYQTDTVVVLVVSGGGSLLTEGFEGGFIPANWTTGGSAPWFATPSGPFSGFYSARSGAIGNSQTTYLQTTVSFTGTKTISFNYRVSSEANFDGLVFGINGAVWNSWTGETGWGTYSTTYTGNGSVTLRWEYDKSSSGSAGQDAAWIDNVVVQ